MLRLLSLWPVKISRQRRPFPRHWKSNQLLPSHLQTIGEQIKKHRLELHWLQSDVAAKIRVSVVSVSNWERGITLPSRKMTKRILEFLAYAPPVLIPKKRGLTSYCLKCKICAVSAERCLFEEACKSFNQSYLQSQVHATELNTARAYL
jgi:transcriptional regulator with XRE-family HTH domain